MSTPEWKQFEVVLSNFGRPEQNIREEAEKVIESLCLEPDRILHLLILCIGNSQLQIVKEAATVLLYKKVFSFTKKNANTCIWLEASLECRKACQTELLNLLDKEQIGTIRRKICESLCEIAQLYHMKKEGAEEWKELPDKLLAMTQSPNNLQRESAYYVFSSLPNVFGDNLRNNLTSIHDILRNAISEAEPDGKVRVYACRATTAFILILEKKEERAIFSDLTPKMLELIMTTFKQAETQDPSLIICANVALQSLIQLAGTIPSFFRPHFIMTYQIMTQLTGNEELDVQTRGLAAEVLATFAEKKPGMVRKAPNFCETLIPVAFKMMVDISDNNEDLLDWTNADECDDDDMEEVAELGEQLLDRLSRALGGKTILPQCFITIGQLMNHHDWRYRHAALKGIADIAEGAIEYLELELPNIITTILKFLKDEHPRVRYAACHALGQLSTDMKPTLQINHGAQVLPGILGAMADKNPRVQAHAAAALVNFSEQSEQSILKPFLNEIFEKLYHMILSSNRLIVEQAVMTVAIVADRVEHMFSRYYDYFIPALKDIFVKSQSKKEYRALRGKSLECISFIGLAVKKEQFKNDAIWLMNEIAKEVNIPVDDPVVPYLLAAHGRICKCLEKDFIPYLPSVLPPLFEAAKQKPEISIMEIDSPEANADDNRDYEYIFLQNFKIGIKSSTLEDKCTACEMLVLYTGILEGGLKPYLKEAAEIMVPLLEFYYHDGVRLAATECMPQLLGAAFDAKCSMEYINELWRFILDQVLNVLENENDNELVAELLYHHKICIKIMGKNCLLENDLMKTASIIAKLLEDYLKRAMDRDNERADIDYDEDCEGDLKQKKENDEVVTSYLTELITIIFETHELNALVLFQCLLPVISQSLFSANSDQACKIFALCSIADFVRYCMQHTYEVVVKNNMWSHVLRYCNDEDPDVRRAATYVVGVVAQYGGDIYTSVVSSSECIGTLHKAITIPNAKSDVNILATENAISAIGKILRYRFDNIQPNDRDMLLQQWLSWLPITKDDLECLFIYDFLCVLIESNNPVVLGQNKANIPFLTNILAVVLQDCLVDHDEELHLRVRNLYTQCNNVVNSSN